mmetsp:Transcript_20677/g.55332  ORF Transcript_20677/g.55332 Transcript_20677/m.55332 type:complete len:89 (+) Transcript_20677:400-666(+)
MLPKGARGVSPAADLEPDGEPGNGNWMFTRLSRGDVSPDLVAARGGAKSGGSVSVLELPRLGGCGGAPAGMFFEEIKGGSEDMVGSSS